MSSLTATPTPTITLLTCSSTSLSSSFSREFFVNSDFLFLCLSIGCRHEFSDYHAHSRGRPITSIRFPFKLIIYSLLSLIYSLRSSVFFLVCLCSLFFVVLYSLLFFSFFLSLLYNFRQIHFILTHLQSTKEQENKMARHK